MNGKASMPYPFAAFGYTEYFNADKWRKWADEAYRYDPAAGEEAAGRGRLPERVRAELRQYRAAGNAVHDRYRHRGRRHVEQDRHQGEHQELRMGLVRAAGARRPGAAGRRSPRCTGRSADPTCHGATTAASPRPASSTCSATRRIAARAARNSSRSTATLLAERDAEKRTELTDQMVETGRQYLDRGADHRRHGLLRGQSEAGRAVRRHPGPARARRRVRAHPAARREAVEEVRPASRICVIPRPLTVPLPARGERAGQHPGTRCPASSAAEPRTLARLRG